MVLPTFRPSYNGMNITYGVEDMLLINFSWQSCSGIISASGMEEMPVPLYVGYFSYYVVFAGNA